MHETKRQLDIKLSFFDSAKLVNEDHWNAIVKDKSIYLSLDFLCALELANIEELQFRYVIFYNGDLVPIAVACIQILHYVDKNTKYKDLLCTVGDKIKNKLLKAIDAKVLLCGNIFACGETGYAHTGEISTEEMLQLVDDSMKRIISNKEKNGQISFSLFKEFWPNTFEKAASLKKKSYRDFMVDVNMVMDIPASWDNMDDYLAVLTSKFRTKAKSVYKKSGEVIVKDLSAKEIEKHLNRIEELHHEVLSKAAYKFGQLNGQAFLNYKKNLGERFILTGYFLDQKLIGFSGVFHDRNILDANYVGLDYEYNKRLSVYQRMLYDFVNLAMTRKCNEIRFGRTAETIKSSIGARPVNMKLYAKHRNTISNKLIGPMLSNIEPAEYELRPPYKLNK